jgi:hypothetical protein
MGTLRLRVGGPRYRSRSLPDGLVQNFVGRFEVFRMNFPLWEIAGSAKKDHIVQFADIDAWVRGERRGEAAAANLCFQA